MGAAGKADHGADGQIREGFLRRKDIARGDADRGSVIGKRLFAEGFHFFPGGLRSQKGVVGFT